jgi:glutamate/tyrosine decarboxylase-like PLP-dependent enzyme
MVTHRIFPFLRKTTGAVRDRWCESIQGENMGQISLPEKGLSKNEVLSRLKSFKSGDADWHKGQLFGLIYEAGEAVEDLVKEAATIFMIENGLSPMAFPSLLKMETEVISMVISMMEGDDNAVGCVTSGGTESIFMAMKAARDWARSRKAGIQKPEMIVPVTAHPAWNKAAHYLGLDIVMTPVDDGYRADIDAMRAAITENTIILGATAVTYPHGMVDPIAEVGDLATENDLWLHVDACLGGLMLPFLRKLAYPLPPYDFRVPGVKSISADIHKYAYTPKGISTVLYRNSELRKHQFFMYADWPGGIYGTPSLAGARPGGTLAAAWAVLHYLGEEGFIRLSREAKTATDNLMAGIGKIPGLFVLGDPDATVFAFGSETKNIYELGARLKERGWHVEAQHLPASLHMTVSPVHLKVVDLFLGDLAEITEKTPSLDSEDISEMAAMYGMIGTMTDRRAAKEFALEYLDDLYRLK